MAPSLDFGWSCPQPKIAGGIVDYCPFVQNIPFVFSLDFSLHCLEDSCYSPGHNVVTTESGKVGEPGIIGSPIPDLCMNVGVTLLYQNFVLSTNSIMREHMDLLTSYGME